MTLLTLWQIADDEAVKKNRKQVQCESVSSACLFFFTCVSVSADLSDAGKETQTLADDQEELEGKKSVIDPPPHHKPSE